ERNLENAGSWLSPFTGFGPSNFLVGQPEFQFDAYRGWFDQRFPSARFAQISEKMGPMVKYAIGAFVQSLGQNPGIEQYLQSLGTQCHVYVGPGLGDISVTYDQSLAFERALRKWNAFWGSAERCAAFAAHSGGDHDPAAPRDPGQYVVGSEDWINAK